MQLAGISDLEDIQTHTHLYTKCCYSGTNVVCGLVVYQLPKDD